MSGENITINTTPTLVTITPTGGTIATVGVQGPAGPQGSAGPGATPGGSSGQLQYNNAGSFGGAAHAYIASGNPQVNTLIFAVDPSGTALGGTWQYGTQPSAVLAPTAADQTLYYVGATGASGSPSGTVGGGVTYLLGQGGGSGGPNRGANGGSFTVQLGPGGNGQTTGGDGSFIINNSDGSSALTISSGTFIANSSIQANSYSTTGGISCNSISIAGSTDTTRITVTAFSGQVNNLQEWKNSGGTNIAYIGPDGKYHGDGSALTGVGGSPGGSSGQLQYNSSSAFAGTAAGTYATSGSLFTFAAQAIADIPLVLKAISGQTGDLQEWQNSSGTALSRVDSTGSLIASKFIVRQSGGTAGTNESQLTHDGTNYINTSKNGGWTFTSTVNAATLTITARDNTYSFSDGLGAGFICGGAIKLSAELRTGSGQQIGWSSASSPTGGNADVGFKRSAAGIIAVTNGSSGSGTLSGTLTTVTGAGAPATTPADGTLYVDTTNLKLYARCGGAWKSVTLS